MIPDMRFLNKSCAPSATATPKRPKPAMTGPILMPQVSRTATVPKKITRYFNERVSHIIKALENRSACLMSNHGQVAFGKNLDDAFELAQEIENICHQYTIALKLGKPKILSFEEMKKVLNKAKNYKKG